MKIRPIIMCGGAGTRLWPKSKKNTPKQFIDWGGWTLFDKTLQRIKNPIFDYPIITTNTDYLKQIKKHLHKNIIKKSIIILEPFKKNTAPAILSSTLIKEIPNDQPMIFITSDNLIENNKKFNNYVSVNKKHLNNNNIFIFGIKATTPSSEYGYFLTKKTQNNLSKVFRFIEKPNKNKAKVIIKNNGYMNAGMFFARKDSLINNFKEHQPAIFKNCYDAVKKSKVKKNLYYLERNSFKKVKDISFDYAILEKAKDINGIKMNISLTDLGNWKEIWKFFKGKKFKKDIKKNTYYRPWGKYINLFSGKDFLLKELVINPMSSISLQKHFFRSERWTIIEGKPKITIGNKKFFSKKNETVFIPKGAVHRIENVFKVPVKIVEVQMGSKIKESDIVRYSDIYGRVK